MTSLMFAWATPLARVALTMLVAGAGATAAAAQTAAAPQEPVPPRLALVLEAHVQLGTPIEIGQVARGRRRIIPITAAPSKGRGSKARC